MPVLYYVPIIHSIEDYGSLEHAIKGAFVRQAGEAAFADLQESINEYWKIVAERIEKILTDARGLIIYHDGFPVGSPEKILELFEYMCKDNPKSPNFRLVKKLLDKGAVLEGTEDMNLAIEQLKLYQHAVEASTPEEQAKILVDNGARSREITRLRDVFIAKRIHDTLPDSRNGILFIGRDHDVITELERLSRKFTVISL